MKKLSLSLLLFSLTLFTYSQVFNTASTLKKGMFSAGIEPGIHINGGNDFYLYLHGGAGLNNKTDLGIKLAIGDQTYIGGDLEFLLSKRFTLSVGAHSWGDFALDGTGLFTFPIGDSKLFTGLDVDIVFADNDTYVPLWIPLGVQIGIKSNVAFILETNINVTDNSYHFIGGGVNFFF